ncbi:MAG: hypothetical protein ACRDT4_15330 [Micromonosporaceae bacterium]
MSVELSRESRIIAGILLLALVTVETGGLYLVSIVSGATEVTAFQLGFARAGHAHAGVLLILSLVACCMPTRSGYAAWSALWGGWGSRWRRC